MFLEQFRFEIEEYFVSKKRGVAVAGRIQKGKIHNKAEVSVVDEKNNILCTTKIVDIDWFGRYKTEYAQAEEGQNILILFPFRCQKMILKAKAVVILEKEEKI